MWSTLHCGLKLVSNSQGCCLAAGQSPGLRHSRLPLFLLSFSCFHRPAPFLVYIQQGTGRGDWNTKMIIKTVASDCGLRPREFDTNNTHTILFDPDYNMMPPLFPLPCHHVINLGGKIAVASTPGRKNARASFCGRLSVWNRTAPDRRHLLPVATTKLIMQCV